MAEVPLNPAPAPAVPPRALGPGPTTITCPSCGATVETSVTHNPTAATHIMALLLCCLCICCVFILYVVDSCQNADHHCPNCDAYLGTYVR